MVQVPSSSFAGTSDTTVQPVRRVRATGRTFWLLFAIEGLLIVGALLFVVNLLLPTRAPLASTIDHSLVREAVLSRLNGDIADPLIEVTPGVSARSSSIRGFSLNGLTYYYYIEGESNFDPFSRNAVAAGDIQIVLRDASGPSPLVIYVLTNTSQRV